MTVSSNTEFSLDSHAADIPVLQRIGVAGAGVIGTGVACAVATAGLSTVLFDVSANQLARASTSIRDLLRSLKLLRLGPSTVDPDEVLGRIQFANDISALAPTDFIVENVSEDLSLKLDLYRQLDALMSPSVVLAANTSVMSITRLASVTNHPGRVIGMHFMNPVPLRPMVEVVRGVHTSDATATRAAQFLQRLGKRHVVVHDAPGFVLNRVLMLMINESIFLLHEGTSTARDIDALFKGCCGHATGPLETADLIGLDTILASIQGLYESFADSKFRPCPLLARMVHAGLLGRKSGQGFYSYHTTLLDGTTPTEG